MGLEEYRSKRSFSRTSEPEGRGSGRKKSQRTFVVQRHAARRLHYDFRLELNGVLKSWAVPKGPSYDPKERRLAVETEDHPLEYATFEGTIPKGEYGAGTVETWDRGTWTTDSKNPGRDLKNGRFRFYLSGEKMHGAWNLVRFKKEKKNAWFLIKAKDSHELPVRPMPEIAQPQLAVLVNEVPVGDNWIHEVKFDGYRILVYIQDGKIRCITRNGNDWTHKLKELAVAAKALKVNTAILDGELVWIGRDGKTHFQELQNAFKGKNREKLAYFAFDLLFLDGADLRTLPLLERKEKLESVLRASKTEFIRYSDHLRGHGPSVHREACRLDLEGIVSKRADAGYEERRSRQWLKVKCSQRQEFVVGGYTEPRGSREGFGALLLGLNESGKLRYVGRVGTGFTAQKLKDVLKTLRKEAVAESPFDVIPREVVREKDIHWVKPKTVVEVKFSNWTQEGVLRVPVFLGIRADKSAREVSLEKPLAEKKFQITNPHKKLFAPDITKLDLAYYYDSIADLILPYLKNRPLALVRCPDGHEANCFFQKHGSLGNALTPITIREKGKSAKYMMANSKSSLIALVQSGVLEIHGWGATSKDVEKPDQIVFDLDPSPNVSWDAVLETAQLFRNRLSEIKLRSFVKTTGGKGLHVVVPIKRHYKWDEVKTFAHLIAKTISKENEKLYTTYLSKKRRVGKIFIDYLRNTRGATAIVPFSTRAKAHAPVAVPLSWDELPAIVSSDQFTLRNIGARLRQIKKDPWEDFFRISQDIPKELTIRE